MSDKATDSPGADSPTAPAAGKLVPGTDSERTASTGAEVRDADTEADSLETGSVGEKSPEPGPSADAETTAESRSGSSELETVGPDGATTGDAASGGKDRGTAESSQDDDSGADSVAESDPSEVSADSRTRRMHRPRLGRAGRIAISGVVAVLFIAAVASSVYFYLQDRHDKSTLTAREQARATACTYGPVLATYDSKHLDTYFRAVLAGATGDWRKQFDSTSKDLRDVLVKGEVTTTVSDVQCAIVSGDTTSAQAIVVVGQSISSLGTQGKPEPGQLSISMRLQKDGDRWLVNKVDSPLATPPGS